MQRKKPSIRHIRKMEILLERIAYLSVGLDVFVAVAMFLVVKKIDFSAVLLSIGDYLILIETAIAAVLFVAITALKYYIKLMDRLMLARSRRESRPSRGAHK